MSCSFGEFLKLKRQENNLTQKDLAKMLFVSESTISKWEKNIANPDISMLPNLSKILGVTEHELITASVDNEAREEKKQAKKWRALTISWDLFFYISYAVTLLTCFICNLAVNKTLSWFWIVLSALIFAFSFTNLPKHIKKNKLILLPVSMFLSVCLLLGVCCIYTNGNWFWISILSILFGFVIVFVPIYISKYNMFATVKKYNDFISIGVDFIFLNILLIVINIYTYLNNITNYIWYIKIALPIIVCVYLVLNLLLCVRLLKLNKFLNTSIILFLIDLFLYGIPPFIRLKNVAFQNELDNANIFKANLSCWKADVCLSNNVHLIIALTLLFLSCIFLIVGVLLLNKKILKKTQI